MPSGIKMTASEFALHFTNIHPSLTLLTSYENMKIKIRVRDSLGIVYLSRPQELLLGKKPTMESAEDKNKAFEIKSKVIHGDKYSYDKLDYKNARTTIILNCPIHGYWECHPDAHLNLGHGCHLCGKDSSEAKRKGKHAGWGLVSWEKQAKNSRLFSGFKLYIIKCWNEKEEFFKIGRTYMEIRKRFEDKNKMPYKWEIILLLKSNAKVIYDLENSIKRKLNIHKYVPNHLFDGSQECFQGVDVTYFAQLIKILRSINTNKITNQDMNTIIDKIF